MLADQPPPNASQQMTMNVIALGYGIILRGLRRGKEVKPRRPSIVAPGKRRSGASGALAAAAQDGCGVPSAGGGSRGLHQVVANARVTRLMAIMSEYGISKALAGRRSRLRSTDRAVQRAAAAAIRRRSVANAARMPDALAAAAHAAKTTKKVEPSRAGCPDVIANPSGGPSRISVGRTAASLPSIRVHALRVQLVDGASENTSGRRCVQVAPRRAAAAGTAPRTRNAGGGVRSPAAPIPKAILIPTGLRAQGIARTKIKGKRTTANRKDSLGVGVIRTGATASLTSTLAGPSDAGGCITPNAMWRGRVNGKSGSARRFEPEAIA